MRAEDATVNQQTTKYSTVVMEAVRLSLSIESNSTQLDQLINTMTKVEIMDSYLETFDHKVKGRELREVVKGVFGADLNYISEKNYGSQTSIYPVSVMESLRISLNVDPDFTELDAQIMAMTKKEVMDRVIEAHDYSLTGEDSRVLINEIFGMNLDGISGLEHVKISIYSKGQWILQGDTDLFIVSSSLDDVELFVATTAYFKETTGTNQLPDSLKQTLISFGFTYTADVDHFIYRNSTNESVSDAFKGQVLGSVVGTIHELIENYSL